MMVLSPSPPKRWPLRRARARALRPTLVASRGVASLRCTGATAALLRSRPEEDLWDDTGTWNPARRVGEMLRRTPRSGKLCTSLVSRQVKSLCTPNFALYYVQFVKINRKHRCRRSHAISLSCRANLSLHKHTNLLSNSALVHMVRSFLGALLRPIEEPLAPSRRRVPPWEAYRAPRPLIFYSQCSLYEYAVDDFLAVLLLC